MRQAGPFELISPLGRGGMGVVWRARHPASGAEVAVKTLGDQPRTDRWREQFRREVQAVARLDHPAVIGILDAGLDGDPWMAMELARGGTLASYAPTAWPALRRGIDELLGGLAFAHARGVIHRDLKPTNVLLGGTSGKRWKLADFGIAQLAYEGREARSQSGTPGFMAPEQLRGTWRQMGPATDIYALGCLVWHLVCGCAPFDGDIEAATYAHLHLAPPRLEPRLPVPADLEAWLRRCLEKHPRARFERAAEARAALAALAGESIAATGNGAERFAAPTATATATQASTEVPTVPIAGPPPAAPRAVLPLPADPPSREGDAPTLAGAGLGLYALRIDRLVGREDERRALWGAARRCAMDGRLRVALLRGPSGAGKSALAQWLAESVHESGGSALLAAHGRDTHHDGLGRMARTILGAHGLTGDALRDAADAWAEQRPIGEVRHQLAERIEPGSSHPLSGPEARHRVVDALIAGERAGRPSVLWVDDMQWGEEAVAWLRTRCGGRGPFVIATVQEEALADRPDIAAEIDALCDHPDVSVIEVGPLPADRWPTLIAGLLQLSRPLAEQVAARTHGNPFFARQLVGDWVARGLLQASPAGFELAEGAEIELPASLAEVWRDPVDRWLAQTDEDGRTAILLGATLGVEVEDTAWEAACTAARVGTERAAMGTAMRAAWIRPGAHGWSFVHGMLREALLAVPDSATTRALNAACAAGLATIADGFERTEAIARHLLAAGQTEAALRPLWQAALHRQRSQDIAGANRLLDEREALLAELALPESHPAWPEGWAQRGRVQSGGGIGHSALEPLERAVAWARMYGWNRFLANAAATAASHMALAGRITEATELADELEGTVEDPTDLALVAMAHASACLATRDYDACRAHLARGQAAGPSLLARTELYRLQIASYAYEGKVAEATASFAEMIACVGDHPSSEIANAREAMGVLHHVRGEWEEALRYYAAVCDYYRSIGSEAAGTMLNISLVRAHRGELEALEPELSLARGKVLATDPARSAFLAAIDLRIAASESQEALDRVTNTLERSLQASGLVDTDIEGLTLLAADDAEAHGFEAHRVRAIHAAQAKALRS